MKFINFGLLMLHVLAFELEHAMRTKIKTPLYHHVDSFVVRKGCERQMKQMLLLANTEKRLEQIAMQRSHLHVMMGSWSSMNLKRSITMSCYL